jgi:CPA2 family monovalent cation:H+ antiporter-2
VLTCSTGAFLGGNDTRTSLRVGMGLAQIGEFSFIIASLGVTLKVTSDFLYPIAVAVSAITTLLTPYLIRGSDGVGAWLERAAPRSVLDSLAVYTRWVGQVGGQSHAAMARKLMWRWSGQMALNSALVAAVFIAAAFVERQPPAWVKNLGLGPESLKSALWLAAVVCSLPLLIATFRKLQALGLLVAQTKVTPANAGERTAAIQAVVTQLIPVAGALALAVLVLGLSSALLPSLEVLLILLALIALITWLLWRSFIRVYAKAQAALRETFDQAPLPRAAQAPAALPTFLREADLETVVIAENSRAAGRMIRELELRTRTGASIVGIERGGASVINPGPDEELRAGDQVLLIGTRPQITAATAALQS